MKDKTTVVNRNKIINSVLSRYSNNKQKSKDLYKYEECQYHKKPLNKICLSCQTDICVICENNHKLHSIIKNEEIYPDDNEIRNINNNLLNYLNDYEEFFSEIKNWKKEINNYFAYFENEYKNNIIINNKNFIYNFSVNKSTFNSIKNFRKFYADIIGNDEKNNKILNYINQYEKKNNKNFLIAENNRIYNNYVNIKEVLNNIVYLKKNLIKKTELILNYLINLFNRSSVDNIDYNNEIKYKKFNSLSNQKKSLSYKDLTINSNDIMKNNIKQNENNSYNKITYSNNTNNNNNTIFNQTYNCNMYRCNSNKLNNPRSRLLSNEIKTINDFDLYERKNTDSIKKIMKKNDVCLDSFNTKGTDLLNSECQTLSCDKDSNRSSSLKNLNSNFISRKILLDYDTNKINNVSGNVNLYNKKNNQGKIYVHKKFISNKDSLLINKMKKCNINQINSNLIDNLIEQKDNYQNIPQKGTTLNNTLVKNKMILIQPFSNKESTFSNENLKNNVTEDNRIKTCSLKNLNINVNKYKERLIDPPLRFDTRTNIIYNNINNYNFNNTNKNTKNKKNNNTESNCAKDKKNLINIIKTNNTVYELNQENEICLGLQLDDNECKLGIFEDNLTNKIKLFPFAENKYSIPSLISFDLQNNISIGFQAEENMELNSKNTIFNFIKLFKVPYEEIINNYNYKLWPFNINNDNNKPFIIINEGTNNEKKYYFDELLYIYLKELFKIIFNKAQFNNITQNEIKLILVITVPDSFSFYQRKCLEKIINNDLLSINEYSIKIKTLKIESSSCLSCLCLPNNKSLQNILVINVDGCSSNVALVEINNNSNKDIYEIKAINSIKLGKDEFNNNLIKLCLDSLKIKDNDDYSPSFLYKIIKLFNINKFNFNSNEEIEIKLDDENKIVIKKDDFEKISSEIYKKIIILIKDVLKNSQINEKNIDDIILIGLSNEEYKFKEMLKELFRLNKNIYEKLNDNKLEKSDIEYYIVAGASLQAMNINNQSNFIEYNNISNVNLGIESLNDIEYFITKGTKIPIYIKKKTKLKINNDDMVELNIYEKNESEFVQKIFNYTFSLDKNDRNGENIGEGFIELDTNFEIDCFLNIWIKIKDKKIKIDLK